MTRFRPRMRVTLGVMVMVGALVAGAFPAGASAAAPAPERTSATSPIPATGGRCSRQAHPKRDPGIPLAERWHLRLRTEDGKRLAWEKLKDGRCSPVIGIGLIYRVAARVPESLRPLLDGGTVEVQHREEGGDAWTTVKEVHVGRYGRIRTSFRATDELVNRHGYRIAVLPSPAGAAPAAMPGVTSGTTSATGVSVTVVQVVNNSGNNLNLQVPSAPTGAAGDPPPWGQVEVGVSNGATISLVYQDPPEGILAGFTMTKSKCFLGCTVYIPDWSCHQGYSNYCPDYWKKAETVDVNGTTYKVCTDADPQLVPGGTYTVTLNPGGEFPSSDFIRGYLSGPLAGLDAPDSTCIFSNSTNALDWFVGHPGHMFEVIGLGTLVVAGIVIVSPVVVALAGEIFVADGTVTAGEAVLQDARLQALFHY